MDKEKFDLKKELQVLGDFTTTTSDPTDAQPYVYGQSLVKLMKEDDNIVCLCADVQWPTENDYIKKHFPDRYYQMGIAEANMMGVASGMAKTGDVVFTHTFCAFTNRRSLDQIAMQVAYPKAKVIIVGFLPGISTILGVSHQAIEDVACFRSLPNMNIFEPYNETQVLPLLQMAKDSTNPSYIRMRRFNKMYDKIDSSIEIGKPQILQKGSKLVIFASGMTVDIAIDASKRIEKEYKFLPSVINVFSLKPINQENFINIIKEHSSVISIENHNVIGGLGSLLSEIIAENGLNIKIDKLGVQDTFAQGAETEFLFKKFGISSDAIVQLYENIIRKDF